MPPTALAPSDVARFVSDMPPHAIRLLAGRDAAGLAADLALGPRPCRPVLFVDPAPAGGAEALAQGAIGALARAATGLWPFLWGGEDFSAAREDAATRIHLSIRFARLARCLPGLSQAWAVDAALRLLRGRPPCGRDGAPELAWAQLVLAVSPPGLVIALPLPPGEPAALVAALEWLANHAEAALLVLAPALPDAGGPYERLLFGARTIRDAAEVSASGPEPATAPVLLAQPEVEGRPHPLSAAEMQLHRLVQADAELRPLLAFNRIVPGLARISPRVDILWAAGRVVVEIDGPEHRSAARYRADRHRDFELTCAGYRVLRLTNEDVIEDAALALARIRDVVRMSRSEGP